MAAPTRDIAVERISSNFGLGRSRSDAISPITPDVKPKKPAGNSFAFIERRLKSTGQETKKWSNADFRRIVRQHVDDSWGSCTGKLRMLSVLLITFGSATLNIWYLSTIMLEYWNSTDGDYHISEWVLSLIEVSAVAIWCIFFVSTSLVMVWHLCKDNGPKLQKGGIIMRWIHSLDMVCYLWTVPQGTCCEVQVIR